MKSGQNETKSEQLDIEAELATESGTAGLVPYSTCDQAEVSGEELIVPRDAADGITITRSSGANARSDIRCQSFTRRKCPDCNGSIERIPRRVRDRVLSFVIPVRRYSCRRKGWGCEWEGNLR